MIKIENYTSVLEGIKKNKSTINIIFSSQKIENAENLIKWDLIKRQTLNNYSTINCIFDLDNNYRRLKKYVNKLKKISNYSNVEIGILNNNSPYYRDFVGCINGVFIDDRKKQIEYLYDETCNMLDENFSKCNYCDFKNDKCIANRAHAVGYEECGCCHSFEIASFFSLKYLENEQICKHLVNKSCNTKNISCKLFTCGYLRKNKIKFSPNKILMLDTFFNRKQKDILTMNFFKTREEILEKLYVKNRMPYILYFLGKEYKIKSNKKARSQ